jgi:N-acyl-L-homoserine lactone synthetase
MDKFIFKVAAEPWEFEQIHRLNYRTFVEEIPQHSGNESGILIDKFHEENTYIIALFGRRLAGMVALRGNRPFSLDSKLDNLDSYLPPYRSLCEIRLLAIDPDFRTGAVFRGLIESGAEYGLSRGYDLAVISGTVRQTRLYRHLGFVPFGPLVGTADAMFQPMYWTLAEFQRQLPWLAQHEEAV